MPDSNYTTYSNDSDFREELSYRLGMIDNDGEDWDYAGSTADSEHHWRQLTKKVCFIDVGGFTLAYPREWDSPQNQEILSRDLQLYVMWADSDVFQIEAFPLDGLSESVSLYGEYLPYDIATGFNEAELKQATEMIAKGYL